MLKFPYFRVKRIGLCNSMQNNLLTCKKNNVFIDELFLWENPVLCCFDASEEEEKRKGTFFPLFLLRNDCAKNRGGGGREVGEVSIVP